MKAFDPLQHQEPLAQQHGVTSQKVYIMMLDYGAASTDPNKEK
jgi:hypothetical protein